MLKQGDYEMWRLRIEQYFQVQDYALWDVIENGNSFKPVAHTTTNDAGTLTTLISCPITIEDKAQKKNAMKARSFRRLRNKPALDIMSIDDLYNNFKIVEQEVKGTVSSNSSSQNMAFMSSPSTNSTNEVYTAYGVSTTSTQSSTTSTQVSTASSQTSTANLSDAIIYAFLANQSNRGPRNQDSKNMYQDSSRRTVNVKETPPKAMVAIDGVGFDWSFMAYNEVPTNMALMAFSDTKGGIIENINLDEDVVLEDAQDVAVEKSVDVKDNADIQGRTAKSQAKIYKIDLDHANKVLSMQEEELEPIELQEVVDVVTIAKIITEVVTIASTTFTAANAKEDNAVKRYQALKRKPQTEAQARKNMMVYLKNVAGFKMDYFKGMSYDDMGLVFEKYFNSNVAFLQKSKEQMDEKDSKALKRLNESKEEKAAKK
nr:ribonuclease H-like domain-containing protein [Tanacetum cinerariifolium]